MATINRFANRNAEKKDKKMNKNLDNQSHIANQAVDNTEIIDETVDETDEDEEEDSSQEVVKTTEYGPVVRSYFKIKVKSPDEKVKNEKTGKMEPRVLYENAKEPFEHQTFKDIVAAFKFNGAKNFPKENAEHLEQAFSSDDDDILKELSELNDKLLKMFNRKEKQDRKSSTYQSLNNKHTPLEGERKLVAIAKMINTIVRVTPGGIMTPELVIEMLKGKGSVDKDYTLETYLNTKIRKSKDEDDE